MDPLFKLILWGISGLFFWWVFGNIIMSDSDFGRFIRASFKWYVYILIFTVIIMGGWTTFFN